MAACQVVTIATSTGAHAEQIGQQVAEQLVFRYVNEEIIAWAADKAGVTPDNIERVEHSTPLVQRVLESLGRAGALSAPEYFIAVPEWQQTALPLADASGMYRNLIREVILERARSGRVVITAHAAGIQLAGMEGLLRVFITGSADTRAQRLVAEEQLSSREARQRIAHTDRERQTYLRRFHDVREELPTHYDLVVNTDVLTPAQATQVIVGTANAMA